TSQQADREKSKVKPKVFLSPEASVETSSDSPFFSSQHPLWQLLARANGVDKTTSQSSELNRSSITKLSNIKSNFEALKAARCQVSECCRLCFEGQPAFAVFFKKSFWEAVSEDCKPKILLSSPVLRCRVRRCCSARRRKDMTYHRTSQVPLMRFSRILLEVFGGTLRNAVNHAAIRSEMFLRHLPDSRSVRLWGPG
ncbi:hypothetical protein, partial [Allorhodopirellula heiligendammensis]|uniref:hypothetical protein n=1 Tax=Allorhodopirellula heiligendammensis TaxID=2714739 RepID=UPI00265EC13D